MNFNELPRVGKRNGVHVIERPRYTSLWIGIGSAVVGAASTVYSSQQAKKLQNQALDAQRGIGVNINYEPIDIEKLKTDASRQAIANATASLAIERDISPDVSATREELARQIRADLELGGNLSADVANQVTMAGRTIGAGSGIGGGSTTPLTASLIGLKSIDLINQRRHAATNLLQANDLPIAGLDPGALASIQVAQNAAMNDFNLAKAGVSSKLSESEAAARASQVGSTAGMASALSGLVGQIGGAYLKSKAPAGGYTNNPDDIYNSGGLWHGQ